MYRMRILISAILVLSAGTAAAVLFRREVPQSEQPSSQRSNVVRRVVGNSAAEAAGGPTQDLPSNVPGPIAFSPLASLAPFDSDDPRPPRFEPDYPQMPAVERLPPLPKANAPTETTHRVVDGDTLGSIAQRYLHDASRAAEIFDRNRAVLSDPELLPIGAELRIPPK